MKKYFLNDEYCMNSFGERSKKNMWKAELINCPLSIYLFAYTEQAVSWFLGEILFPKGP